MRCKCCDKIMSEWEQLRRVVTDEHTGKELVVYEDMCKGCRDVSLGEDEDDVVQELATLLHLRLTEQED